MRVFCFGDIHFGSSRYQFVKEQEERLIDWVKNCVKAFNCRGIVVLGDLFKERLPDVRVKDQVYFFLKELVGIVDRVWVVAGNHDYYDKGCEESGLEIYKDIDRLVVIDKGVFEERIGGSNVVFIPWREVVGGNVGDVGGKVVFTHAEFKEIVGWEGREQVSVRRFKDAVLVVSGHLHDRREMGNVIYVGMPFQRSFADGETGGLVIDLGMVNGGGLMGME